MNVCWCSVFILIYIYFENLLIFRMHFHVNVFAFFFSLSLSSICQPYFQLYSCEYLKSSVANSNVLVVIFFKWICHYFRVNIRFNEFCVFFFLCLHTNSTPCFNRCFSCWQYYYIHIIAIQLPPFITIYPIIFSALYTYTLHIYVY